MNHEKIIEFLNEKSVRETIISYVFNQAQLTLFEIGMNNPEIWEICGFGSYIRPDPNGRWSRITLPQYPNIFVPAIYVNKRNTFAYGPSDFDAVVLTDNSYSLIEDTLHPLEKRSKVIELSKGFKEKTGVELSLRVVSGLHTFNEEETHRQVFGFEKFEVMYKRE